MPQPLPLFFSSPMQCVDWAPCVPEPLWACVVCSRCSDFLVVAFLSLLGATSNVLAAAGAPSVAVLAGPSSSILEFFSYLRSVYCHDDSASLCSTSYLAPFSRGCMIYFTSAICLRRAVLCVESPQHLAPVSMIKLSSLPLIRFTTVFFLLPIILGHVPVTVRICLQNDLICHNCLPRIDRGDMSPSGIAFQRTCLPHCQSRKVDRDQLNNDHVHTFSPEPSPLLCDARIGHHVILFSLQRKQKRYLASLMSDP